MILRKLVFSLIISFSTPAFAQHASISFLREVVGEGATAYAKTSFYNSSNQLVDPESVYYVVSSISAGGTYVSNMHRCSQDGNKACARDSDCTVGTCDTQQAFECSDSICDSIYFCKSAASCQTTSIMDLSLLPAANQILNPNLAANGKETRQISVWFTAPDGCTVGVDCVWGSGGARYEVVNRDQLCVEIDHTSTTTGGYHGNLTTYKNSDCTAADTPYDCCTGNGTGRCCD